MKNRISFILVLVLLFSFCFKNVSASELCSSNGYSIYTINGINTDKRGAQDNKIAFQNKLKITTFNNQPLTVDYLYNPTHLGGVGDLIDAVKQGFFDQKSDYDLVEMLNDASQKVTTQKLLLVSHSQGNFYANNFYDKVADQEGGVPSQSIGVYSVATPANRVAGGGKYLTSNTDGIIAGLVGGTFKRSIMSPNIHIVFQNSDDKDGHDFSKVYLKYQGDRIVSDIKSSLYKLKNNDEQDPREPCISPQELSMLHKAQGLVLAVVDSTANFTKKITVDTISSSYKIGSAIGDGVLNGVGAIGNIFHSVGLAIGNTFNNLSANVVASFPDKNNLTTLLPNVLDSARENSSSQIKTAEATPPPDPNSASAEGNLDSSVPVADDSTVIINNDSGNSGNNGSSGGDITPPPVATEPVDIIPPVITIIGDNPIEIVKDSTYADAGATALDDVDGDISANIITVNPVDTTTLGTYTITYDASDVNKNAATQVTRTINVVAPPLVPDTTSPIITLIGDSTIEITKDTVYTDAGATAQDDVDGDITANIITVNPVDTTTLGTYTITYDASDVNKNAATQVIRTVKVVAPLPPPPPPLKTVTINENTTLAPGEYTYDNLIITNNAVLTLAGDPTSVNDFKGVKINAVNITVDAGSSISADGKGYGSNQGPGASSENTVGASYGGLSYGAASYSKTYGSATKPIDLGSGGASLTYGGGAVRIIVSDTFLNNGIVSANGNTSSSGGSIYVTAKNIKGGGKFSANGGVLFAANTFKSPGGGGRIAIYYQTSLFSGTAEAKGGCGQYDGMTMTCSGNGTVGFFDESANDLYLNKSWEFQQSDSPFVLNNIYISNGAQVTSKDGANITANNIFIDKASTFTLSGGEIVNAGVLSLLGKSIIVIIPEKILSLKVSNLNIENGSKILAEDKGYVNGPGTPTKPNEVGASYGGKGGGATAQPVYGSDTAPMDFGSGGSDGRRGGGAIRLVVDNNFKNDGIVSANGNYFRVSGGSIYVTTDKISGSGVFQANGGNGYGYYNFGGGGGRIAIHYKTSDFSGTATALAGKYCDGGCRSAAEVGTVKMIDDSIPIPPPLPVPQVQVRERFPACPGRRTVQGERRVSTPSRRCFVAGDRSSP